MPTLTATQVFDTARGFLNDTGAELWTDTVLLTRLPQAHRELQAKLRQRAVPVMKKISSAIAVASGDTQVELPTDLVEPIRLWEVASAGGFSAAVDMTEKDPLPNIAQTTTLRFWQWDGVDINLVGASANRDVFIHYWRRITIPTAGGTEIGIIDGELYLAPRVAAIAAGSVGQTELFTVMTAMAEANLETVIVSNRGRGTPTDVGNQRP